MNKEQQKDKIIEIVKKAIDDNSVTSYGEDDIVSIDGDDVDHIAEEVAEEVCCQGLAVGKSQAVFICQGRLGRHGRIRQAVGK